MVEIVVYGKPDCTQCFATTNILKTRGVEFVYRDVTQDPEARSEVEFLGYQSLPVVVAGDIHWSGYRFEKIRQLIHAYGRKEEVAMKDMEDNATRYLQEEL